MANYRASSEAIKRASYQSSNGDPKNGASKGAGSHKPRDPGRARGLDANLFATLQSPRIVWAIDAFANDLTQQIGVAHDVQTLFPHASIYPVYVLSEDVVSERAVSSFLKPALKPMAQKKLQRTLSLYRELELKTPRILLEPTASRSASALRLIRFAKKIGANLIAMGSRGQRSLSRFLIGSFSEAVLDRSPVPVLFHGPQVTIASSFPRVLIYPTDFSPACSQAYEEVLSLAAGFGAELHLFHNALSTLDPIVSSGVHIFGGGWVAVDAYMSQPLLQDHSHDAKQWIDNATERGVRATYINESYRGSTSDAIVNYVHRLQAGTSYRNNPGSILVAMVSQSGPVASALLGSVTRDVIRGSSAPVIVVPRLVS
jgi:nucleotide-binding universal stress UspA family protein